MKTQPTVFREEMQARGK